MKNFKKYNGITLVSLVVTIVVLLILSGVTINALVGDNGLINMARKAKEKTEEATKKEQQQLAGIFERNYVTYNGQLHVDGKKLMNEHNEEIRLIGMHGHGTGYWKYYDYESFKSLKEKWNNNCFRIIVNYTEYLENKELYLQKLYNLIDITIDLDMYFIICWGGSSSDAYIEDAKEFFTEIATKYNNIPNIIYEIWNEPGVTWDNICEYSNVIIPIIRNINKNSLILVGTPTSAAGVSFGITCVYKNELNYTNIMYTDHFYNYGESTNKAFAQAISTASLRGVPIFISEWGITNASGQGEVNIEEANKWLSLMNQYNLSWVNHVFANSSIEGCSIFLPKKWSSQLEENTLSESGKYISNIFTQNYKQNEYSTDDYTMILSSMQSGGYFWDAEYRENITEITFKNNITTLPQNIVKIWDISKTGQGKVIAYLLNDGNNEGKYLLYIITDGEKVYVEGTKGSVFRGFTSLETIDITCLESSKQTEMYAWFYGNTNLKNIVGLENLNVNNVTKMRSIFAYCSNIEKLNLTNFKFSKLEDYKDMFYDINENAKIYVKNVDDAKFVKSRMNEVYKNNITIYYGSDENWSEYIE